MNARKRRCVAFAAVGAAATVFGCLFLFLKSPKQREAEALVRASIKAGYKMDAGDFDLDIGEAARRATGFFTNDPIGRPDGFKFHGIHFHEPIGSNAALVLWREPMIADADGSNAWPNVRAQQESSSNILSQLVQLLETPKFRTQGQGQFGNRLLLPHLTYIRTYSLNFLWQRTCLALHDGRREDAWIALRSLSRLATRWEPEPFSTSQSVRFSVVIAAQQRMWDALQDSGWSEDQLRELQAEWEHLDLLSRLPDAEAVERVMNLVACEERRVGKVEGIVPSFWERLKWPGNSRMDALKGWFETWNRERSYRRNGVFEDEIAIITCFNEREDELKNAIGRATFVSMKERISTTNQIWVRSSSGSEIVTLINLNLPNQDWLTSENHGLLGRLSNAESRRRILVTALAVKRHAISKGRPPESLDKLVPDFLRAVPADYIDGLPLRYRSRADGGFLIYSVGLDCKDDGGDQRAPQMDPPRPSRDIVWPFAASEEDLRLAEEASRALEQMEAAAGTSLMILDWLRKWRLVPVDEPQESISPGDRP